jgi:D-threo-aldose 1-dehydrogenase
MWNCAKLPDDVVARARSFCAVADAFSFLLAATALQFPLGNHIITPVIPGPRQRGELPQILEWFETPIPAEL